VLQRPLLLTTAAAELQYEEDSSCGVKPDDARQQPQHAKEFSYHMLALPQLYRFQHSFHALLVSICINHKPLAFSQ
jgi:hypothetical protein